ncbi:MAG: IS630 family transposase [SAR324 cluster bacterium]|uniref:IS630 family transposase n=2 Tax=SAR324 cluster bacterium TaxID=2024889 RepID=A0A432G0X0_9DELT|nr:MAG: IS630 family transposase [SAR324 cluster bacterium]
MARKTKYIVKLSKSEREKLNKLVKTGKIAAAKRYRAQIFLYADEGDDGPCLSDPQIAKKLELSVITVQRARQRLIEKGLDFTLERVKREKGPNPKKLDPEQEAKLISLACIEAPEGHARWSLRLLSERMVALDYVDSISHETVRQTLKKKEIKPWQCKEWCIAPQNHAGFVCAMEDILNVYQLDYSVQNPLVCMDETSKQLTKETRVPIPANTDHVEYYDSEYERNGTANIFMFFNPIEGKRRVDITDNRTAKDWAHQIKQLVDVDYPEAKKITLVMDNLNTHVGASLYKTFNPKEARRILDKLDFHYTPKHGSWLNMAEIEFSILGRECLDRRIPDKTALINEVNAWTEERNSKESKIIWRFKNEDARIKLKRLYPLIK